MTAMQVPGFALIRKSNSAVILSWEVVPIRIEVLGELRVDGASLGWENETFRIDAHNINVADPPDPGSQPPSLVAAAFNLTIENGDVSSIEGAFNLIAALYLDVGQFMLLFLEAEPDTEYFAQVIGGSSDIRVTDRFEDSLIVEAKDGNGQYVDPNPFSIQVYRI